MLRRKLGRRDRNIYREMNYSFNRQVLRISLIVLILLLLLYLYCQI